MEKKPVTIGITRQIGTTRFIVNYYDKINIDWVDELENKWYFEPMNIFKKEGNFDIKFVFVDYDNVNQVIKDYPDIKVALRLNEKNYKMLDILDENKVDTILINRNDYLSDFYDYIRYLVDKNNKDNQINIDLEKINKLLTEFNDTYDKELILLGKKLYTIESLYGNAIDTEKFTPLNNKEFDHDTSNIDVIYSTGNIETVIDKYGLNIGKIFKTTKK